VVGAGSLIGFLLLLLLLIVLVLHDEWEYGKECDQPYLYQ
jgi:hypothetical protein